MPEFPDTWGLYASRSWNEILLWSERDIVRRPMISYDSGKHFKYYGTYQDSPWTPSGDVEGGRAAVYVQGFNPSNGLERTTDTGYTWINVGGPSNFIDTRFCVIDCNGAEVVAFGVDGSIWLTTDGGDGTLHPENAHPKFASVTAAAATTLCEDTGVGFRFYNDLCRRDSLIVQRVTLLDSSSLAVTSGAFGFDSLRPMPFTMPSGTQDSMGFHWDPGLAFANDTTITERIGVHYWSATDALEHDTILTVTLTATPGAVAHSVSPHAIAFGSVSTCSQADTTITVWNDGCQPMRIDSATLAAAGFVLGSYDSIIPPGATDTLVLHFIPTGASQDYGLLHLYLSEQGLHQKDLVELTGQGVQGFGVLAMRRTSLEAGSFSFCDGDTVLTDTIRNTGCDTLVLSKIRFGNDSAFALLASPDSLLLPGASGVFQFLFSPRKKGAHAGTLSFHWQNIVNDPGHDTTVTISGNGLGGNTALALDTTTRNFGNLFECEERDTTIWLYNPGCDTLRVDSAAFPNAAYASDTSFPLLIPAGDSVPVRISLISNISPNPGSDNGAVTFYSNANTGSQSGTVQLLAKPIPPAQLHLTLSPAQSAHAGQLVNFYVILTGDTGPAARELTGISFDLTHNDDLLSFVSASGMTRVNHPLPPPWKGGGIQRDTFVFTPPTFQGGGRGVVDTIGTLTFRVYLTDSSTTPLTLSNIAFGVPPNISPDCIASIDSGASGFTYLYQCGDHILQDYLRTGSVPFHIESIVPNPATTEIIIRVVGGEDGRVVGGVPAAPIEYELFNALGKRVLTSSDVPGSDVRGTSLQLDVSALPSGIYFLRISRDGYMQSQSVAIER